MNEKVKKGFSIGGFIGLGLSVTALIIGGISNTDIIKTVTDMTQIGGSIVALIGFIIGMIGGKK